MPEPYKTVNIPLPAHVIYLGVPSHSTGGSYLLLDTELGDIVEIDQDGFSLMLDQEQYDALAEDQRWMAHWTLSAEDFFARETRRLEKLVYVPVPSSEAAGEPSFYLRATTSEQEAQLLTVEDEYDANQELDPDFGKEDGDTTMDDLTLDTSSSEDDQVENDEDMEVPSDELDGLRTDADEELDVPGQITANLSSWTPENLPQETLVSTLNAYESGA